MGLGVREVVPRKDFYRLFCYQIVRSLIKLFKAAKRKRRYVVFDSFQVRVTSDKSVTTVLCIM